MRVADVVAATPCTLLLVDDVRDAIREHAVGSRQYVQSLPQQKDLAVLCSEVTEEPLVNVLPEIPDF